MGQKRKVTGIVLSSGNVGDYDKRVVLLTKENGKITAFAKGARKMNSPYLAACQPFVYGEFMLYEGKNYNINSVEVKDYFEDLKSDLELLYRGLYFCEMAEYFTVEENDDLAIMQLLYMSLLALRKKKMKAELIQVVYELKMTALFGWMMETSQCVVCHKKAEHPHSFTAFSVEGGGLVCRECAAQKKNFLPVSETTVYTLQYIMSQPVNKLFHFNVSDEVVREVKEISALYLKKQVNHVFKSLKFLNEFLQIQT